MLIIYHWCQLNRSTPVSFYLGITFPARYLPLAIAAMDFVNDGNFVGTLCGMMVAHAWWIVFYVYGERSPFVKRLLQPPKFMYPIHVAGFGLIDLGKECLMRLRRACLKPKSLSIPLTKDMVGDWVTKVNKLTAIYYSCSMAPQSI